MTECVCGRPGVRVHREQSTRTCCTCKPRWQRRPVLGRRNHGRDAVPTAAETSRGAGRRGSASRFVRRKREKKVWASVGLRQPRRGTLEGGATCFLVSRVAVRQSRARRDGGPGGFVGRFPGPRALGQPIHPPKQGRGAKPNAASQPCWRRCVAGPSPMWW